MAVLKSVLKEELKNSLRMNKEYEKALKRLPKGSLRPRIVKGHCYYYLAVRKGEKVHYIYKGKLSKDKIAQYKKDQKMRAKFKKLLSKTNQQIKFLQRALRGKEEV